MSARTVYVLNGPNLNLLGQREPSIYGSASLADIQALLEQLGDELGIGLRFYQTNSEGVLVDQLHQAMTDGAQAVLLNAGAYTHTSLALYDAIRAITVPVIEVHLSNPHTRETFRHKSYVGMAAKGTICGFGPDSYLLALRAAAQL